MHLKSYLWRSLLNGALVIVPAAFVCSLLVHVATWIRAPLQSIASVLPFGAWIQEHWPMAWAVLALLLLCLLTGVLLSLPLVQSLFSSANKALSGRFPLYMRIRGFEASYVARSGKRPIQAALVELDETLAPAFVAEELPDGRYVIFVPATPSIRDGCIYVMTRERVHLIDASAAQVAHCIRHWGVGTGELLKTLRKP